MQPDAYITPDGKFRYWLSRIWDDNLPTVTFIGLNPSTADAKEDDNTIRKCIAYAKRWDKGGLYMVNLFAFRDTHQTKIWNEPNRVGPKNNTYLADYAAKSSLVVAAWGNEGRRFGRSAEVCRLLPSLQCLKVNMSDEPHHPLYLSPDIKHKPYHRHG
jgi:hypothetical protein